MSDVIESSGMGQILERISIHPQTFVKGKAQGNMSLRRQKPEPPAATGSRFSDVLAIGLATGAVASVAKIKREEDEAKAVPKDIADSFSELMRQLEVDGIEMKRNQPQTSKTIVLDDADDADGTDGTGSSSASTPCPHASGRASKNMRRAPPCMGWNYGRQGITDDSDNARKKKRTQEKMARMLYLNYRLVPVPGDEPRSDNDSDDTDDLVTEKMVKLVTSYRAKVKDGVSANAEFDAMYSDLVEHTHTEVTTSATNRVTEFVDAAYADTSKADQVRKPVLQVVSTDEDATASYQLYLEKASDVAMQIRVEVPNKTQTWRMAASSRPDKAKAKEEITALVTERGVLPKSEFNTKEVKDYFRGHLRRNSADVA